MGEVKIPSGISETIDKFTLHGCIKTKAKWVYSMLEIPDVPRKVRRQKYLCHCIHQAYIELGMVPPSTQIIAQIVGTDKITSAAAINNKPKYKDIYNPTNVMLELPFVMRYYASEVMYFDDMIVEAMITTFEKVLLQNKDLLAHDSNALIGCFIVCYLRMTGFDFQDTGIYSVIGIKAQDVTPIYDGVRYSIACS